MDANLQSYSLVLHQDADPRTGGVAVCGFTAGMVGVISTSHHQNARSSATRYGDAQGFPCRCTDSRRGAQAPVRVYQGDGIGVFTSEIQFGNETDIPFATTVLEWFTKGGFDRLIIIDGITRPEKELSTGDLFGVGLFGVGTHSVVSGITGFLLGEGDRLGIDITALLSEASPMYPDARAAALAVEAVGDLTGFEIPLTELLENARSIEDSVRDIIENAAQMLPAPDEDTITDIDPSFG